MITREKNLNNCALGYSRLWVCVCVPCITLVLQVFVCVCVAYEEGDDYLQESIAKNPNTMCIGAVSFIRSIFDQNATQ